MSTSAEQFALMGGVFLILGGAFVFAPQIINAVNGFLAALFRRPRNAPKTAATQPEAPLATAAAPYEPIVSPSSPEDDRAAWAPPEHPQDRGAVSRLRDEISSSWGSPDQR